MFILQDRDQEFLTWDYATENTSWPRMGALDELEIEKNVGKSSIF